MGYIYKDLTDASRVRILSVRVKVVQAAALKGKLEGREIDIRYRWPDRLTLQTQVGGSDYEVGRDGDEVWTWAAEKKFAVVGVNATEIQSVLFALDFWVANADLKNVASATRYTKYNWAELLERAKK